MHLVKSLPILLLLGTLFGCDNRDVDQQLDTAVSGLRIDTVMGDDGSAGYLKALAPESFDFPQDHGPHPGFRSEWWYLTAVLNDDLGNQYGLHYTLFRQALTPEPTGEGPWHTGQAYLGHLALTDVTGQQHFEAERFSRGHPELAGVQVSAKEFHAVIEDWQLQGEADPFDLQLTAAEPNQFAVEVSIFQDEPLVLQGERGYSEKGPGSASFYYSMPRLSLSGSIQIEGKHHEVVGLGWLDREWSTSLLGDHLSGWDWMALQLDDQRSIMAFQLRRKDGKRDSYDHGLLVDHRKLIQSPIVGHGDAGVTLLKPDNFSMQALRYYTDDSGVAWPVAWQLEIGNETFLIEAMLDDQRVDLAIVYWEGIVAVSDTSGNPLGRGYMELTGYETGEQE